MSHNFTITAATAATAPSGTLEVDGDFAGGTSFSHNSGTVSLNGAGGTTQHISGNSTFYVLSATTTVARTLQFASGSTTTVAAGGGLTLTGSSCTAVLALRSSTHGELLESH